jgi:voltage-gated potassium channel Kch
MGLSAGHIDDDTLGLITLVGLITIGLSTYLILYSHALYERIGHLFSMFEREQDIEHELYEERVSINPDVILYGLGRYGGSLFQQLHERGHSVLGIDFDPGLVSYWRNRDYPARYGDAEDPEFPGSLPLGASWVISTIREEPVSRALLHGLEHHGYPCKVGVTADLESVADRLRASGADLVLMPYPDAAKEAADMIDQMLNGRRSPEESPM